MPWTIRYDLGIKSDHTGRRYRLMTNSFGREDKIYIQDTDAPAGYTIPIPPEPKPKLKGPIKHFGTNKPVVHIPKRLHVVEVRWKDKHTVDKIVGSNGSLDRIVEDMRPFGRSPDCGETWLALEPLPSDHHVQYHIDEEIKDAS